MYARKHFNFDKVFVLIVYTVLILFFLVIFLPFFYVLMSSFSTRHEIQTRGFYLIPREWSIGAYGYLINNKAFLTAFTNSVYITSVGTLISISTTALMAYGISKTWLKGRRVIRLIVMFTMVFSGGIIPTYMVVSNLQLMNSFWALWLLGAVTPYNLIVMSNFFRNMPSEIEDSAKIDGCGEWTLLLKIVLPLSAPAIATFTLFYMVLHWNSYFNAILYLNKNVKWPLQVFLRQMLIESGERTQSQEAFSGGFEFGPQVKMAAVIITALPMLAVYPFLQKHFNQGMMLGSVKG